MPHDDKTMANMLKVVQPISLPPAEYPPAIIVRDTPREELEQRIRTNAEKMGLELTDEHWEVINWLFDFYIHCCDTEDPGYLEQETYWKYVNCLYDDDCRNELAGEDQADCPHGKLSRKEATKAYPVYRILVKAFKHKGGSKHLYTLFPYGPLFTIHLLAQLPRLMNDANPHFGTAF